VLTRGAPTECVVASADGQPNLVAVMRFRTPQSILDFLDSEAYQAHLPYRTLAFRDIRSYIADDLM